MKSNRKRCLLLNAEQELERERENLEAGEVEGNSVPGGESLIQIVTKRKQKEKLLRLIGKEKQAK